jgi:hypothetical protein
MSEPMPDDLKEMERKILSGTNAASIVCGCGGRRAFDAGRSGMSWDGAIERRDEFLERTKAAHGDAVRLADLMAEAIGMLYEANGLEIVGRDGRQTVCIEKVCAAHCMFGARDAYLMARGSNLPPGGDVPR